MTKVTDEGVRRSPDELAEARRRAGRMRARWLLALERGEATPYELMVAATREGGQPLRALRLRQMLAHVPGYTRTGVDAVLAELRSAAGVSPDTPDGSLNIRWLLMAPRTVPGARLTMLATAMLRQRGGLEGPGHVSGFPYGSLGERRGA